MIQESSKKLTELREQKSILETQREIAMLEAETKAAESYARMVTESEWRQIPTGEGFQNDSQELTRSFNRGSLQFSTIRDRSDGRYIPYFDNESDLRYMRQQFRNLHSWTAVGGSIISRLGRYVIRKGFKFNAKAINEENTNSLQPMIDDVQRVIDAFLKKSNFINDLDMEIHDTSREDGEVFLALFEDRHDGIPVIRRIESDEVTEPASTSNLDLFFGGNDGRDHWEFGIHTRDDPYKGFHDTETPFGYHCTFDDSGQNWNYIPEERMVHVKRNVKRRVKRGLSDYYWTNEDLEGEARLNRNVREGMSILACIPYVKHSKTPRTSPALVPGTDSITAVQQSQSGNKKSVTRRRYQPGEVPELYGMEYAPGPLAQMTNDSVYQTIMHCFKRMGGFWDSPMFMLTGDTETALYSAVLAMGSPFVCAREADQAFYARYFKELIWKAIRMVAESGKLGSYSWNEIQRHIELSHEAPTVAITDEMKQAQTNEIRLRTGEISLQTAREISGLDHDEEEQRGAKPQQTFTQPSAGIQVGTEAVRESVKSIASLWEQYP